MMVGVYVEGKYVPSQGSGEFLASKSSIEKEMS